MKRQYLGIVISVVLLPLVVISCSGEKSTSAPAQSSALELYKLSTERGRELKSVRATADIEVQAEGERMTMAMTMEKAKNGRTSLDSSILVAGAKFSLKMIAAEPDLYLNVLDGGWYRASQQEAEQFLGGGVSNMLKMDFAQSLFPPGDIPWDLYKVERLNRERIAGAVTDHLRVQFDFREVWARLGERDKLRFAQSYGMTGAEVSSHSESQGCQKAVPHSKPSPSGTASLKVAPRPKFVLSASRHVTLICARRC